MKPQLRNLIRFLSLLPFAIIGIAWMVMYPPLSDTFIFGIGVLVLGFVISVLIGGKATNAAVLLASLSFAYLFGEGVVYLINPYENTSGFNKKSTIFDPVRGYRWLNEDIRYFKNRMGEVVYDNQFHPNNKGWIMKQDYSFKKADSTTKRWMLLGDSFVAGIMLETNLPDRMQETINDSIGEKKIEIYAYIFNHYLLFYRLFTKKIQCFSKALLQFCFSL